MFKSHELVVQMKKKDKNEENPNQTAKPVLPPRDPWFELRMFVEESTPKIVGALVAYKLCTTVIRAAEHVVVTKVK